MMLVKNLEFQYKNFRPILREIAFEALPGECLAVLGNNGAGKSTMLKCLNRILTPRKGTVYVGRNNIFALPFRQVAQNMAFVAQGTQNSRLTVYDMVMLGRKPYIKWSARREDTEIVETILAKMNLTEMAVRFMDELSGGEQQKIMLARALAQQPSVLLLDEPTSNLDLRNQYEVLSLVTRVCRENNIAVVIVIHDLNLALRYCDKFMLIKDNQVYAYGGAEIITSKSIEDVYQIPALLHNVNGMKVVIPQYG